MHEKYETGQFFLHRVFGYRGVVLFPWRAKVYDRNTCTSMYANAASNSTDTTIDTNVEAEPSFDTATTKNTAQTTRKILDDSSTKHTTSSSRPDYRKEVTVNVQTFYQVLIDSRDCPHVVSNNFQSFFSFN